MFTNKPIQFLTTTFDKIVRLRGKGFHIEIQDDKYYNASLHVIVKRCFFNEFFKKTGHSYLTGLFCAAGSLCYVFTQLLEAKMLEGIDPLKYNVRLDIPRTLAGMGENSQVNVNTEGYKCCSFQFKRMQFLEDFEAT